MPKRLKATERRASILAVAKLLFADKGYHGVSVDEIATRLGVSPAILYRHFDSKESLYEEVLNELACRRESYVDAIVTGDSDFASVLRRITRIYVDSVARDPDYLRMEMHSVLEGSGATRQFFENRWKPFSDYIEVGLKDLVDEGYNMTVSPPVACLMFQGFLREALYAKCILKSGHYREIELQSLVDQLLALFFKAIGYDEK
ncbi:MAG: TetR/AcrR family transcriptional regulator [Gammaproteobacteria bacterium]